MSDKSFGDHTNRTIIKNPLLSTAVTGLSIEDLTHNAVLLPAAPTQELITRPDQQTRPQIFTLAHSDNEKIYLPSGDSNANLPPSNILENIYPPSIDEQNNVKHEKFHENIHAIQSKASVKSDDFDVTEYFARLQGTKYVSAPLNSHLKEEQNANLGAEEENLEEINLNEPDKVEVQQSLTADIAQNFSQLPTVLPQVASAVFSSFSNILSYKSREQTPDDARSSGYQEIQFPRPEDVTVPLMAVEENIVKDVAPPPKEPPVGSLTNYRISTKKRYAQIPGLSSGDTQHISGHSVAQNPPYFTPGVTQEPYPIGDRTYENKSLGAANQDTYNIFNPLDSFQNVVKTNVSQDIIPKEIEKNVFTPIQLKQDVQVQESLMAQPPIIPPPPMFSNLPRRDSTSGVGKSVLPPSVARRISANHPIIKPQVQTAPNITNIFIPSSNDNNQIEETQVPTNIPSFNPQTVIPTVKQSDTSITTGLQSSTMLDQHLTSQLPTLGPQFTAPPSTYNFTSKDQLTVTEREPIALHPQTLNEQFNTTNKIILPKIDIKLDDSNISIYEVANTQTTLEETSQVLDNKAPEMQPPPSKHSLPKPPTKSFISEDISSSFMNVPPAQTLYTPTQSEIQNRSELPKEPQIFVPMFPTTTTTPESSQLPPNLLPAQSAMTSFPPHSSIPPSTFFNPIQNESSTPTSLQREPVDAKDILEPPKVTGNLNYRMTKKRPQYYAGPIEGIGAISNNVKPVIPVVDSGVFHGALFTPEHQNVSSENTANLPTVQPDSKPFDISKSFEPHNTFQINKEQSFGQQAYNTSFDLSRETTDNYDDVKEETKGFGIIGSLKSKLSSIDINKIQNSVTTFFDPAYNEPKKETNVIQDRVPYGNESKNFTGDSGQSNFEIFVPNVEQPSQTYDYQNYGQSQQYDNRNFYQNQSNTYPNSYYSDGCFQQIHNNTSNIDMPLYSATSDSTQQESEKEYMHSFINSVPQDYQQSYLANVISPDTVSTSTTSEKMESTQVAAKYPSSSQYDLHTHENKSINFDTNVTHNVSNITNSTFETNEGPNSGVIQSATGHLFKSDQVEDGFSAQLESIDTTSVSQGYDITNTLEINKPSTDKISEMKYFESYSSEPFSITNEELSHKISNLTVASDEIYKPDDKEEKMSSKSGSLSDKSFYNTFDQMSQKATNIPNISMKTDSTFHTVPSLQDNAESLPVNIHQEAEDKSVKEPNMLGSIVKQDDNSSEKLTNIPVLVQAMRKDDIPLLGVSSVPLFGLSTMLADKSKEISDVQESRSSMSLFEVPKTDNLFDRNSSISFFENIEPIKPHIQEDSASELNICETCREVNIPEDIETEDLTTQLIENITSPIQLLNPVEVPLTETAVPVIRESPNFDANQFAEIAHITEETIETIQVQSAVELLDDVDEDTNFKARNYGWNTGNIQFPDSNTLLEHDYSFKLDPGAIGFFGSNSLFFDNVPNNASDEIKAEFKHSQEDNQILPRQMSIPSAPPAEEDSKSDETGIDVHSIEQDANKDFPIYEEFVIEPSETDDDKIEYRERERSSEDPIKDIDTFTNRLERFKKMEEIIADNEEVFDSQKRKVSLTAGLSPAITIASYFDTGNYAVEAHYKNSGNSPTLIAYPPMSIPPGFEEEYHRKMSGISRKSMQGLGNNQGDIFVPYIPETSTQTRPTSTLTYEQQVTLAENDNVTERVQESKTFEMSTNISDFTNVFEAKPGVSNNDPVQSINTGFSDIKSDPMIYHKDFKETPSFFDSSKSSHEEKSEKVVESLPDPINFFSTQAEPAPSDNSENSFNRLASYFASPPPKPDHSKSFFELSQSQNHYRHKDRQENTEHKTPFDLPHNSTIPHDKYLMLMKDLTSSQNIDIKTDQVVRTINYFTVEYDNPNVHNEMNFAEPKIKKELNKDLNTLKSITETCDDRDLYNVIKNCQCCYSQNSNRNRVFEGIGANNCSVRKCMDNDTESKEKDCAMESNIDGARRSVTVNLDSYFNEDSNDGVAVANENRATSEYTPVRCHWFYRVDVEDKSIWRGFSPVDSKALEDAFHSPDLNENTLVPTDGGRYDVNVIGRLRIAVYWTDKPTNVRRCSWFYKGNTDARYVPYTEAVAERLEEEYRHGITTGEWHRRLVLPNNEMVVMHGPGVMVHFLHTGSMDAFSSPPQSISRTRVVRRGCEESEVEESEPSAVDHLLLLCHGVGSACDMRFRPVEQVVDDFRATSLQLLQSHYRNSYDNGVVNRIEVLPISWHATLHSGEGGVDRRLAQITLDSIPRLRNFTNDTVLDVLFYTSPVFCQTIIETVCKELNRIYTLFKQRNPNFTGGVSVGGHSLGSVILYDLLCHQMFEDTSDPKKYVCGSAGTGQPTVHYPKLLFSPKALYALGSPIAIFECIRGVESLGPQFSLPTCKNFFNIFHPYDPIAYRIEPLINPQLRDVKPFLIPHHKGRKRMHLELKDTMVRVGSDLKQKLIESLRMTWNKWKPQSPPPDGQLEKVVEEELEKEQLCEDRDEGCQDSKVTPDMLGNLNAGRRVDYVLQEAPLEIINEYLFAMTSHVRYWESEDTMLLILREIYDSLGVRPDCSRPQNSLTVERTRTDSQDDTGASSASEHPSTSGTGPT